MVWKEVAFSDKTIKFAKSANERYIILFLKYGIQTPKYGILRDSEKFLVICKGYDKMMMVDKRCYLFKIAQFGNVPED